MVSLAKPTNKLSLLLDKIEPVPQEWLGVSPTLIEKKEYEPEQPSVAEISCDNYNELIDSWKNAMYWTEGLDVALSVMLASIASTKMMGDQLWIKIISPPAGGKSTLCEALSANTKHVEAKSTIRGLHSGYKVDNMDDGEDNSLISIMFDRTLIIKDGDTLLQAPNLKQILSEFRDVYDSTSRTHYRNKASKDYEGVRMTVIFAGTSSLRALDQSELGARFLDCVIMDGIDHELENKVLDSAIDEAFNTLKIEADHKSGKNINPDMVQAQGKTAGYVSYLRDNAVELISTINASQESKDMLKTLGKFVAYMRARPSEYQEENAEREFATRLSKQFTRLAGFLAVVLNRESVDSVVMERVTKIALDTARGQTLDILKLLCDEPEGVPAARIATKIHTATTKTNKLLRFLSRIGVIELTTKRLGTANKKTQVYVATQTLSSLYSQIVGD